MKLLVLMTSPAAAMAQEAKLPLKENDAPMESFHCENPPTAAPPVLWI